MTELKKPDASDTQHEAKRLRLIAAVLDLQHSTSMAANIVPISGTNRVIAIGKPVVARLEIEGRAPWRSAAGKLAER